MWVNPRVSASGFSVQAGGMAAALPYCDALVSGHSFKALSEVVDAIGVRSWGRAGAPGAGLKRRAPIEAEDVEPWASATPVAGSSVAMPSGHGPAGATPPPGGSARSASDDQGARA